MTLTAGCGIQEHRQFIEDQDIPQKFYEQARKAALDRRFSCPDTISSTLDNHGVAGIFIDPEQILVPFSKSRTKLNPRRDTALYHAHLSDQTFETVARSLAEGIGVSTTARINNVDKKTVLLVLAKAAAHVEKINEAFMQNLFVAECQLDEMWSFVGKKEKNLNEIENCKRSWVMPGFGSHLMRSIKCFLLLMSASVRCIMLLNL